MSGATDHESSRYAAPKIAAQHREAADADMMKLGCGPKWAGGVIRNWLTFKTDRRGDEFEMGIDRHRVMWKNAFKIVTNKNGKYKIDLSALAIRRFQITQKGSLNRI